MAARFLTISCNRAIAVGDEDQLSRIPDALIPSDRLSELRRGGRRSANPSRRISV
ncbi:hypothetical protein KCP73_17455 [Salmonella enterica subsp. enterica]|nr:hypothetical protein KCP73_17455 [Salmonella enterica subsp. enterica]